MTGSLPPNLVLSLIFGAGQIVVGAWLAWHTLHSERRAQWRAAIPTFAGLWFVVSGAVELFVSGMESNLRLTGAPSSAAFALWRSRADTTLYAATAILALGVLLYPLMARRWLAGSASATSAAAEGAPSVVAEAATEGEHGT